MPLFYLLIALCKQRYLFTQYYQIKEADLLLFAANKHGDKQYQT